MPLTFCTTTDPADWIVNSPTPPSQLICFGPAGFEAYARVRYIRDPEHPGEHEADVGWVADRLRDIDQARRAVRLLAAHTSTPDDAYFCLWDGYGPSVPSLPEPIVHVPDRDHLLLSGPLSALDEWETVLGSHPGHPFPPAFVWPADHRWCFASDVDPHWAGIGANREAVAELIADPVLDVVDADPGAAQPAYR